MHKNEDHSKSQKRDRKSSPFRTLLFILIASFITALLLYFYQDQDETEQSLTYFPDDPALLFEKAGTTIQFQPDTPYTLQWMVESKINKPTYLRQDVSLLFKDQRLIGILSQWKEKTDQLSQMKTLKENESGYYEAITVHHAENHYPNNVIRGKEVMSYDHLSVIDSAGEFTSFRIPAQPEEKDWTTKRWRTLQQEQHDLVTKAAQQFHFNLSQYDSFPLSYLHIYNDHPLPSLNQKTTHRVISQLWEGIYKDYCLGVHLSEHDVRDPIGSMMPIILFDKNAKQILVIIQLNTGEITMLKQEI